MRARLMMKLITLVVMLVLTVVSARSCSGGSDPTSNLNPNNVARNGVAALCANQQATADAAGVGSSPQSLAVPANDRVGAGELAGLAGGTGLESGALMCPTTTLAGGGG